MNLPRPKSVLGLILAGFTLVALPLILAVYRGTNLVEQLALQSESLVLHAVQLTRESEQLAELLTDMERYARQYEILAEAPLLELYEEKNNAFLGALGTLEVLDSRGELMEPLTAMRGAVIELRASVVGYVPGSDDAPMDIEGFARVGDMVQAISTENIRSIDEQVESLQATATNARRSLFWQTVTLIPVTVLLAILFTILIARPVRQIGRAIHRLGEGSFTIPVSVSGPAELTALGEELDWLRRRLIELEQEKNVFLRQMSHELKTPLASIREGTELLCDGTVGKLSATQTEVVEILRESGLELEQRIENLLSFNAWQQSKGQLTVGEFDLGNVIDTVVDNHRMEAVTKKLKIRTSLKPVTLLADRDKVRMAVDNLVSNAVKYSPVGGRIGIRVSRKARNVMVDVMDEGPGIPSDERERIFEPFFQGRMPTGRHVRGTGIGLSVVHECVEAHGGNIGVRVRPTGGSHFRMTLPVSHEPQAA
jgi:two-component system, NtrC family, sensor histidine kinase GlrK